MMRSAVQFLVIVIINEHPNRRDDGLKYSHSTYAFWNADEPPITPPQHHMLRLHYIDYPDV